MTPPLSIQQLIETVPVVSVAAAVARLEQWYGVPIKPTTNGRWCIRDCQLSDQEVVARYRLKCARIQQGIG